MKRWMPLIATVAILLVFTAAADACPMCKDSVPTTDAEQAQAVPSGFNYSVYYMLLSLFATMGFVGFVIVKGIRSTRMTNDQIPMTNKSPSTNVQGRRAL